jgi:hypothetical protein
VDENGQMQNPALPDCGQAISAVKAIAIAQQQGQKIYTITQENRATALAKLPVGGTVGQEIRNAVNAGKEVTVHEKAISAFGWSGYGYIIVDPETGAGAYLIEGSGNGGYLFAIAIALVFSEWIIASIGLAIVIDLLISGVFMAINYIIEKIFNLDKVEQVTVAVVEMLTIFILLTVSLLMSSSILVTASLIALVFSMFSVFWNALSYKSFNDYKFV